MNKRLFYLIAGLCLTLFSYGQNDLTARTLKDGIYKSTTTSFRSNFYVKIAGDSVTLYGWETGLDDTVYFRTSTVNKVGEEGAVDWHFEHYDLSLEPISIDKLEKFHVDKEISFFTPGLHSRFMGEFANGVFKLQATTNTYDSRADAFEFVWISGLR